ncbi:MAG TPA: aminotransferase V, partial [Firmicutes bacterium]|nr:aminotransferase V [Bacillota bacterium]
MIYFDYAANYPAKKEVLETLIETEKNYFGNYNSSHFLGKKTKEFVKLCTENILKIMGFSNDFEIIY